MRKYKKDKRLKWRFTAMKDFTALPTLAERTEEHRTGGARRRGGARGAESEAGRVPAAGWRAKCSPTRPQLARAMLGAPLRTREKA